MIIPSNFKTFEKSGNSLNPQLNENVFVAIGGPDGNLGEGAIIRPHTNQYGQISYVEIIDGGKNYDQNSYLIFVNANTQFEWETDPSDLTIDPLTGEITGFSIPVSTNNANFTYPAVNYFVNQFLEPVSTGLIATDHIFITEKVLDSDGVEKYVFPRTDEYGPIDIIEYESNGTSGNVKIDTVAITGNVNSNDLSTIVSVSPATISQLAIGMYVIGTGISSGTFITDINSTYNHVKLSKSFLTAGAVSLEAYTPHNLRVGNTIRIYDTLGSTPFDGRQTITAVTPLRIYFASSLEISATVTSTTKIGIIPVYRAYFQTNSDEEFFMFTVEYNEDYPTITKNKEIFFELDDADEATVADTIPTVGNGTYIRTVNEANLNQSVLQINVGLQADYEGVYLASLYIDDITFVTPRTLFSGLYEGETVAEDERLGKLLENFGRDITIDQELILRDSDVNESYPDYMLLNAKRKEMLLEGDNIWPYVGSYKGLVNIINWFGYYDIRIKEYWLNVNQNDEYFGKYKIMQIPFQLTSKGKNSEAIALLPSKHYKKTSLFGLYYDIIKDNGSFDENGVPETEDAFDFTNDEILIKLFALKSFLKEKFLPLSSKIIDITGEGVYYERYAVNSWTDDSKLLEVNLTRDIDFKAEKTSVQVIDVRPYDPDDTLKSPAYFDILQNYTYKYNLNRVLINTPGGPYYGEIPTISFPGNAVQQARGIVRMKGYVSASIIPSTFTGEDYAIGDIITLAGGAYENPLKITVVNVGGSGEVTEFSIEAGPNQGSNYSSMPSGFSQARVIRPIGSQYEVVDAKGFTCASTDIPFEAESVVLYDKGLKYNNVPTAEFTPAIGGIDALLDVSTLNQTPVGYFNDGAIIEPYVDAPNISVGAPLTVFTSFDITWDEVPYRWQDIGGSSDATLRAIIDPLPAGSGQLLAVEILNPGDGYKITPTFTVNGGEGFGGEVLGQIKNGELSILEYEVVGVNNFGAGTNNQLQLSPAIPAAGINAIGLGRIVKSDGITTDAITSVVDIFTSEIYLTDPLGVDSVTSVQIGDKIYIHQGVYVSSNGAGYVYPPTVSPKGGRGDLFTWNELGRGDMYQMEWKIELTEAEKPGQIFSDFTGIKPIDELISYSTTLPYAGKYTVELIVYDTDNNFINEIKQNYITAFLPDATFSYATRYIENCIDTWDDTFQEPIPEFEPSPGQLAPPPPGVRYSWENANGRWVNPLFTTASWEDAQMVWRSLEVGNFSSVNEYNYPDAPLIDVLQVSAQDNLEGTVISYTDSTTTPSSLNPTITVGGQRIRPEIEPVINPNDWIFIRRDNVIYQLEVLNADYSTPGETIIELVTTPSLAFRNSPSTWEVLREIEGTIILDGNQIYDEVNNPTGIRIGEYIRLIGKDDIPKRKRIGIKAKDIYGSEPNNILLEGGGADPIYYEGGELGKIYKFRGKNAANGNLNWDPVAANSTWVIEPLSINDPTIADHIGKLYILDATPTPGCQPANPTNEIRPGFTVINLFVEVSGSIVYNQRLRTTHAFFDTSGTGHPYDIWNGLPAGYTGIHVVDVVTLDGGSLIDLNTYLSSSGGSVWIEYEYEGFPTRTYLGQNSSGDAEIYMDFNMYPSSGQFDAALAGEFPASSLNDTGWYYDHGNVSGDYSLYVKNTGTWRNGIGTIVTVDDSQSELAQSSSSFQARQLNFDSDNAEKYLGTFVQTWKNSRALLWDETCAHSWDTLDTQNRQGCNFRITDIDQNGNIQFNNDIPFFFQDILGGMSNAEKWSQAIYELRKTDNSALSRFDYQLGSLTGDVTYFSGQLDTYNYPSSILNYTGITPVANDVVFNDYIGPVQKITAFTPTEISLVNPIPKKLSFSGSTKNGSYLMTNITGLLESEVYVGEIVTGTGLPVTPATPAKIVEIFAIAGQVRRLKFSEPATADSYYETYDIELFTPGTNVISFQNIAQTGAIHIDTFAKTHSVDHLGWLIGQNGILFWDWVEETNVPLYHTYPIRNVIEQFGYGKGLVGGFQGGLSEFLLKERSLQVYFYNGLNPLGGNKGWYPAANLPYNYSYIENDPFPALPAFDNVAEAESQANRLPYETAIGGSYRWEETFMGVLPTRVPSGSSVLLSPEASKIAGKTKYLWRLKESDDNVLAELTDKTVLWTFDKPGNFSVELEITDTNGNTKTYEKKEFFEIYEAE